MKFKHLIWVICTTLLVLSCKKEKPSITAENIYKFKEYITEVSSGVISTKSDIKVVLMNPVNDWKANIELAPSILKVSPKVDGKVVALNNRTIAFVPSARLAQDTRYTFALDLGDIQEVPKEFNTFEFDIKTIKQDISVSPSNLQSYSKDWQYLEGVIKSSDVLSAATAVKLIKATQNGKELKVKIDSNEAEGNYFHIKIDSIKRLKEDSEIEITWDGKPFNIESNGDFEFEIPGKTRFTVINVQTYDESSKYVAINFSDPLKKSQNFHGLVTIEDENYLSFSVDGNILKVYPRHAFKDTRKLTVFEGISSADGYKVKRSYSEDISFEDLKPEVRLLQNGTILPTSEDLKFNFEAVGLKAVDVSVIKIFDDNVLQFLQENNLSGNNELRRVARPVAKKTIKLEDHASNLNKWNAFAVDLKEIVNPNPGAIYRVKISFKKAYSLFKCEDSDDALITEQTVNYDTEEEESSYWDSSSYYYDYNYNWSERDNPCHNSYYRDKDVSANILATNLGVTVKKGNNNSYFVAVSDILTTNPVANAEVQFYNYQQQLIGKQKTDSEGQCKFDSKSNAYFAVVAKGKQRTYVRLNDGNVLSVSKFDVAGVKLKRGLKGFIYGERGVWRPGDTLFLSFMLNDQANKLPVGHPVKMELFNPHGTLAYREIKTEGLNNLYSFKIPTNEDDFTGNWNATVSVGGASFTKRVKIETIKPNRLKIKAKLDKEVMTANDYVDGSLEVTWLHGAIAKNLKADINLKLLQKKTEFKAFPGFEFNDPTRKFSKEEQQIFDGTINAEGKASFTFKPNLENAAPGLLKASFITKVYENGGDFSTDVFSVDYSPYSSYVGLMVPKGDAARGMLLTDTKHRFDVATVDENGKPTAVSDIEVRIYKVNQNWWWNEAENNLSSYENASYHDEVFSTTLETNSSGKGSFNFELKYPDWGRYLVKVINRESGHATGKTVFIDWPGWAGKARKGDPTAATMLNFATDKPTYNVGETALVTFPSAASGRALVTIENGSEVIKGFWVKAKKGDTKFELPITKEMTPNVFIHISLLQPHNNTKNDLPIRMYGLTAIQVEDPNTRLQPEIEMPNVLQPESQFKLKVKEQQGKPMTYSIAIVDEGLLDLTRFKTPNPWFTFYAKEALGVRTWDIYDDVIGAFGGRINQVFSIGGDGSLAGSKNKKANRFKPVVIYKGPFELKKNKTNTHDIKLPKYVGSVRTMVVAHHPENEAYGNSEKTTPVRKPLMVLASLPRKVTPGEQVRIPVTVFAMEKKMKQVSIKLKHNDIFKIIGKSSQQLHFSQPDEKMAYFDVEILKPGFGTIDVVVSGNGHEASYNLEINSINPNPRSSEATDIVLAPNATQTIDLATFGVPGTNKVMLEISSLPAMDFNARMQYLIQYPHGCVEQTTSSVFPQLYLNDIFDLSKDKISRIQSNIQKGIDRLAHFQTSSGGFSYWQGQQTDNDWGSSYAGHFLLEAEQQGYVLPIAFKSKWLNYQKQAAKKWRSYNGNSALAQAYRLYTLALAKNAEVSAMNRLRETPSISNEAKYRLAAAYALIGQKSAAEAIINETPLVFKNEKYQYRTYGSTQRNRAMAVESLVLLKDATKTKPLGEEIASVLSEGKYMSTQTTAYSLLAMAKYAKFLGGKGIKVQYTIDGKPTTIQANKTLASREFDVKKGPHTLSFTNKKDNTVYVRVLNSGILPVGEEKVIQRNLETTVVYKLRNGDRIDPAELSQGTDFIAEITMRNVSSKRIKDIALTHIFPSGWEIVNTRFTDFGDFAENTADYTDIRDDRVNFYFNELKANERETVRVLLNASYLGEYYLPGIQSEAMYDDNYLIRGKGQWIRVAK